MISADEPRISPKNACRDGRLARDGQQVSVPTYYRWITRGARSASGRRVTLETVQTPSGRCTTREAIGRFIVALNDVGVRPEVLAINSRFAENAERELKQAGIG